jgi:hypothetical protein
MRHGSWTGCLCQACDDAVYGSLANWQGYSGQLIYKFGSGSSASPHCGRAPGTVDQEPNGTDMAANLVTIRDDEPPMEDGNDEAKDVIDEAAVNNRGEWKTVRSRKKTNFYQARW